MLGGGKYLSYLIFAGLLVSCNGLENVSTEEQSKTPVFYASTSLVETKTSLEGHSVLWSQNDRVSVFVGKDNPMEYKVKDGDSGKTSVTLVASLEGVPSGKDIGVNVAFYPSGCVSQCIESGGNFQLYADFSDMQIYSEGSFSSGAMPMVAVSSSTSDTRLSFNNLFGILKLKLKLDDAIVKSIQIKGNAGEKLSGQAFVSCNYGMKPQISFFPAAKETMTLSCGDGVLCNGTEGTDFYVAIPPCTFENGITVTVQTTDRVIVRSISSQLSILRSTILPMREISESLVFDGGNSTEEIGEDAECTYPWEE